ncbi:MAG: FAD-dependent oxidoreductase [Silvibacterium sp.]
MNRGEMVARIREHTEPWDVIVIGGCATGAGVVMDAATRGFTALLLEREDFGEATSSRTGRRQRSSDSTRSQYAIPWMDSNLNRNDQNRNLT